jgi:hypothetical protein
MKHNFGIWCSLLIFFVVALQGLYGEPKTPAANVNTQFTIRDSLSRAALPVVRVTVENFKQSFTTRKSTFYLPLAAGTYRLTLESDRYETLTRTVDVSAQNYVFTLEMVATADRIKIKECDSMFYYYMGIIKKALQNRDFVQAELNLDSLKLYNQFQTEAFDDAKRMYANTRKSWIDSLFLIARENENTEKYPDAQYYYQLLYAYDSLLTDASAGVRRVDSLMAAKKNKPVEIKKITTEELEKMFQEGYAKFIAADFAGAKKIFLKVLANNPNHEKAKDYLKRTETRLKALGK